jgi:YHS domain-containing protein
MLRAVLEFVLMLIIARVFWRVIGGIMEGLGGTPQTRVREGGVPDREVPLTRDPVCGTFVLPDRAVSLTDGRQRLYFCSTACRDKYRARTA